MVIGLDCADPGQSFGRLAHACPNLSALAGRGQHGRLRSTVPPITVPAWTTMTSGASPGELGLYGLRARVPGSYQMRVTTAADVLVPLLKIGVSQAATMAVREARLVLAGNATLRDFSILPRLSEDAIIQEIWEGTHPILAGHALKALRRPASGQAFSRLLDQAASRGPAPARAALADLRKKLDARVAALRADPTGEPADAVAVCLLAYRTLGLALLCREAGGPLDADGALGRAVSRL